MITVLIVMLAVMIGACAGLAYAAFVKWMAEDPFGPHWGGR